MKSYFRFYFSNIKRDLSEDVEFSSLEKKIKNFQKTVDMKFYT